MAYGQVLVAEDHDVLRYELRLVLEERKKVAADLRAKEMQVLFDVDDDVPMPIGTWHECVPILVSLLRAARIVCCTCCRVMHHVPPHPLCFLR